MSHKRIVLVWGDEKKSLELQEELKKGEIVAELFLRGGEVARRINEEAPIFSSVYFIDSPDADIQKVVGEASEIANNLYPIYTDIPVFLVAANLGRFQLIQDAFKQWDCNIKRAA